MTAEPLHLPLTPYLPTQINTGNWLTGYSLNALRTRVATDRLVLPICSLGTPAEQLANLGSLVLPPLFHEALEPELKSDLLKQIGRCFPFFEGTRDRAAYKGGFDIVELPPVRHQPPASRPRVFAFSVDTAVEEHGPHLPLATDTVQSYGVLQRLAAETESFVVGPPVDYGQLTWGLPFGLSIDITPALVTRHVRGFVNAIVDWVSPESVYVVDVHGSLVHRNAIQEGLRTSRCSRWAFRWLHDSLVEFAGDRGDQHAGGVETALVEHINPGLVDARWWPARLDELARGQLTTAHATELTGNLRGFIDAVESNPWNGIIGDVRNYFNVDAREMMGRMLRVARQDVAQLTQRVAEAR